MRHALLLAAGLLLSGGAVAKDAQYPAEIVGIWQHSSGPCIASGNADSDARITVEVDRLNGYEDYQTPVEVTRLPGTLRAWRIQSKLFIPPDEPAVDLDEIYILTGDSRPMLTVVNESTTYVYELCIDPARSPR